MNRRPLIPALFLIALGGLLLHYRIHPFMVADKAHPGDFIFDGTKFLATILPLSDIAIITPLFLSRRTVLYGYLLNGMLVIFGTVLMTHFSIAGFVGKSLALTDMILKSTLPDIGIAWVDFFIGKALYDSYMQN